MMRKIRFLLILPCFSVLLTGCWDRTEINDNAYVVASGVDKGEKNKVRFSVQIPLPSSLGGAGSSGGGGGTSGEGPTLITQGTGRNIREGMEDIQIRLSRKLYFAHRRVIIIGEDLAKDGILEVVRAVFMQPQSRLSTYLAISKGDAVKLLESQPRMEQFSAEAIREMAKASSNRTVMDVLQDLQRPGKDPIVPVIDTTGTLKEDDKGKEVVMRQFAVLKQDKLSFFTNEKETQGILWLLGKMKKKSFTFSTMENKEITLQIIDNHVKTDLSMEAGKPVFELKIRATGTMLENEPNLRIEDPKTYYMIIRKMEKEIETNVNQILRHSLSEGIDFYGFGWHLYKNRYQRWEKEWKKDWERLLPQLKVKVNVDGDIQRRMNSGKVEKG
ncbi:Ger(x)C family spore germination protein [Neobacillus niacini]|uniref:Ger(x)C family spore germination protein n=1 Tax=Neobacillus niacini TaxID=86668 RepID=UPI0021CB000F|nr:Ger(x)C family spore germination protein [Neobacillus niacini]MCM3765517.1 Ger(x)C family spore germination protein [Neobacillus niacini]